jgi:hypothetical protein
MTDKITFFKHQIGDGLHYITNNFRVFPDGSFQLGDTSENCILTNLHIILFRHDYRLPDVWNQVYPEDPLTDRDMAYIGFSSVTESIPFDATSLDNISLVIEDVRAICCDKLADHVTELLREKGLYI